MGYNSALEMNTCVKEEFIKDVRGILAEIELKISADIAEDWEYELNWLELQDDGWFGCDDGDWYGKWCHSEKWLAKLAPFLKDGDIEFTGEDRVRWGFRIKDGVIHDLIYTKSIGQPLDVSWLKEKNKKE